MKSVVYGEEVIDENLNKQTYTGLTRNTFKKQFNGHSQSFLNRKKEHSTTLLTHVWQLQDKNKDFSVNWKILG